MMLYHFKTKDGSVSFYRSCEYQAKLDVPDGNYGVSNSVIISAKSRALLEIMYKNGVVYATDMQDKGLYGDFLSVYNRGMRHAVHQLNEKITYQVPELSGYNRLIVSAGHTGGWIFNENAKVVK